MMAYLQPMAVMIAERTLSINCRIALIDRRSIGHGI